MSLTPFASEVSVFIGPEGLRVDVWDTIRVDLSMLEVGTAWTLSFWWSPEGRNAWDVLTDPVTGVKCGQRITVTIDGDAVISGVVETREVGEDKPGDPPQLVISGRDELGVALSADADPATLLRGRTIEAVLSDLYAQAGVVADIAESIAQRPYQGRRVQRRGAWHQSARRQKVTRVAHPNIGEKIQQVVDRIVRSLGYRVWVAPGIESGHTAVIVDAPRATGAPTMTLLREVTSTGAIAERSNILRAKESTQIANVPTRVTAYGDSQRGTKAATKFSHTVDNGTLYAEENAKRIDVDLPERPRYVRARSASTVAGAQNEAARVMAEANQTLRTYTASVTGFRQEGLLWIPNSRVAVRDELLHVAETMLLVRASFQQSVTGAQTSDLTLLPDGAVTVIPAEDAS